HDAGPGHRRARSHQAAGAGRGDPAMSKRSVRTAMLLMRFLPAALLAATAFWARAEPVTYAIDASHTRVWWETRHFGTSTQRGRFDDVAGSIVIDREQGRGEVSISIATGSVSSGVPALDRILKGSGFLDAAAYPTAYFVATRLRFDGD